MGASNTSTCRDLSGFELVENADTVRRCGHCIARGQVTTPRPVLNVPESW